jgi:hypothetical protein
MSSVRVAAAGCGGGVIDDQSVDAIAPPYGPSADGEVARRDFCLSAPEKAL